MKVLSIFFAIWLFFGTENTAQVKMKLPPVKSVAKQITAKAKQPDSLQRRIDALVNILDAKQQDSKQEVIRLTKRLEDRPVKIIYRTKYIRAVPDTVYETQTEYLPADTVYQTDTVYLSNKQLKKQNKKAS